MSKKKSKRPRPQDDNDASTTTSMIVDEVNDYEYFKELWNEKMMGTKQQRDDDAKFELKEKQSSVRQKQDVVMHQPKKKRRKLPATDDGGRTTSKTTRKGKMKMQKESNDNKPTSQFHYYDDDTIIATNVEGRKRGSTSKKRKRAAGKKSTTQDNIAGIESKYDVPLYEHISKHRLDTLLGWAASHRGNDINNIDTTTSAEKERGIDLSHLPMAPPPPSHVAFLQQHISKRLQNNNDANNELDDIGEKKKGNNCKTASTTQNNHKMHVSAYVAVGMAVEEALTTRLMPLAKAHVERCRRLEREARDDHGAECRSEESITKTQSSQKKLKLLKRLASAKDSFDAWTLPPAEAVIQLARAGTIKGNDALTSSLLGRQSELEDSE